MLVLTFLSGNGLEMSDRSFRKKNNMRDVARAAGVSVATVSRVLNHADRVSSLTKARVDAAMEALNFTPSAAARAINSGRTRMIGALVPTLDHAIFSQFLNALEAGLAEFGLSLVVATTRNSLETEVYKATEFMNIGVEGLVVSGVTHDPAFHQLVKRHDVPVLATSYFDLENKLPTIGYDNAAAAALALNHLTSLSHERIVILHGPAEENDRTRERLRGLGHAKAPNLTLLECAVDFEAAGTCIEELLDKGLKDTAVLCTSDVLAQGVLFRLNALGVRVPEELSVIGIDDLPSSAFVTPGLTTVRLPVVEMGTEAAQAIGSWVEQGRPVAARELALTLNVRNSTARPRDGATQ